MLIQQYRQELIHNKPIIRVAEYCGMRRGHGNTPLHCFQDCTPVNDDKTLYLRKQLTFACHMKAESIRDWTSRITIYSSGKERDSHGMSYHTALEFIQHRPRIGEVFFIRRLGNGSHTALWSMKMIRLGLFWPIISRVVQQSTATEEIRTNIFPLICGINFFKNADSPLVFSALYTSKDGLPTRPCGCECWCEPNTAWVWSKIRRWLTARVVCCAAR